MSWSPLVCHRKLSGHPAQHIRGSIPNGLHGAAMSGQVLQFVLHELVAYLGSSFVEVHSEIV